MSDLISRQDAIDAWDKLSKRGRTEFDQVLMTLPSAEPKTGRDCTDFVRWLMDEVMDEENWQMNAVANGEIICRKLKKLGLLDVVDGYYVETQKTGEWIDYIGKDLGIDGQWLRDDGKTIFMQCDQCDSMVVRNLMTHKNYCPNCGARMLGEDGEE